MSVQWRDTSIKPMRGCFADYSFSFCASFIFQTSPRTSGPFLPNTAAYGWYGVRAARECPLLLLSRSMSVGYLMSAGATVASRISLPRFFFLRVFFFLDVFGFAFPLCVDALDPVSPPAQGGSSPSSGSSFRSTFRCSSGHFPVQIYSLIFATSSTENRLRKCTIIDGSNSGSA